MFIAIIAFTIGIIAGVILTCVIHKEKPYDTERVEIQITNYFKNVIDNAPSSKIPFDVLTYNQDICEIVRKGGRK